MKNDRKKSIWKMPSTYLMIVSIVVSVALGVQMFITALLPYKVLTVAAVVIALMNVWAACMLWIKKVKPVWKHCAKVLAVMLIVLALLGNTVLYFAGNMVHKVTDFQVQQEGVSLIVQKQSPITDLLDLSQEDKLGIYEKLYRDSVDQALGKMKETVGFVSPVQEYHSINELADALYQKEVSAIVINEACRDLIRDIYDKFDEDTRVIHTWKYDVEQKNVSKKIEVTEDAFNVLITGIDTYGGITTVSRSDVNIIATVNPKTHQVLLTSIPRDYYVPIVEGTRSTGGLNGEMDKLTHTGLFGPDCTVRTLEKVFGIDINYYVKVNFSSLIDIVDALGGITVQSEVAFDDFVAGENKMDGKRALAFARQRYAFESGDRQRGKNQMKVIEAIIEKLARPDFSNDYMSIFNTVADGVEMNFSEDEIMALIRMQIADMKGWTVLSSSVDGTGGEDYSALYGGNLYVMYPDEKTVQAAKAQMDKIMQ